ncbi:MAG TPA: hypothetical protein VIL20_11985 [Sandaracinaceae bacterium]
MKERRATLPVLLVLLAFLGGAGWLVHRAHERTVAGDEAGPLATTIETDPLAEPSDGERGWRHHDWRARDAGAPEPPPSPPSSPARIPPAPAQDEIFDPQMWAMRRSFGLSEDGGAAALPFVPIEQEARIVDSDGELGVSPDAACRVRVLPVRTQRFNCLARVVCDGRVLYPNPTQTAGYLPCDVEDGRPVRAVDDGHTALDGDPLFRLDLESGTVTVEDRGDGVSPFRATLRIGRRP